jgi:hypothetical protein
MQKVLSTGQTEAFYHDLFVEVQVKHFVELLGAKGDIKEVSDIGGGCGFFAKRLNSQIGCNVKVIDMDAASIEACHDLGIEAMQGDALNPNILGDSDVVTFNLILHHLVAGSEKETLALQTKALAVWIPHTQSIFVNEYIYESWLSNFSGWLIYMITKNPILSRIGHLVSKVVPSLKANTFGVGVRFRAGQEWQRVFKSAGYDVQSTVVGTNEHVSLPRRLLLIKHIRRDSFLLVPRGIQ